MQHQMQELSKTEIDTVSGGITNDTGYATSIGLSVAFVGFAIATGGVGAVGFLAASYVSTGLAFYYAH